LKTISPYGGVGDGAGVALSTALPLDAADPVASGISLEEAVVDCFFAQPAMKQSTAAKSNIALN